MSYNVRNSAMGEISTNVKLFNHLKEAYLGNGDFATGDILIKHGRETAAGYLRRKESMSYANYFRSLIDVGTNAIFSREPVRTYTNDPQFKAFIANVDGRANLTKFLRKATTMSKKLGSAWLFMDNSPQPAETVEEAVRDRKLPYMFMVEPQMIKNFHLDYLGNLIDVSYYEQYIDDMGEEQYYIRKWTNDIITLANEYGTVIETSENTVGLIPCIAFISSEQDLEEGEVPFPEYTSIYQLNTKIVNVDSLIINGLYQQGFSILLLAGQFDDKLELGESTGLNYDKAGEGKVDAPSFISPDAAPIETMMAYIELLKTQILEQSITKFASTNSENQSGTAKRIDNIDKAKSLENQTKYIESIEMKIAKLFGVYIGKDLNYTVEYYKDFDIDDIITSLTEAHSALDINWASIEVPRAIKAKQIKNIFGEGDQDEMDKLIEAENAASIESIEDDIIVEDIDKSNEVIEGPEEPPKDEIKDMVVELKAALDAQSKLIDKLINGKGEA